ncbi:MAG: NAD-dependent succinate-semialdehyde dehydrogenase [Planctomycetota bacterium]
MDVRNLYLADGWRAPNEPLDVTNPATGEVIGQVATIERDGMRQVLADSEAAWGAWRRLTGKQRGGFLRRIAAGLDRRREELARLITLENGKPLRESMGEVNGTIDHLEWFAEEARRTYGRVVPHQADGKRHVVIKSPIGVAGLITPWNFPLILAVRKMAPALAAGCPVVLKPATATPLCCVALAEVIEEADLPKGVFQLVLGNSRDIGAELLENPICRKISFTGSTVVGKQLIVAAARNVTKLSLELGGHAPVLVFDDADLDVAVQGALAAKMRNTGQSCIAANRLYVQRGIHDQFLDAFCAETSKLKVGNGLDEDTDIGPLIDRAALDKALMHIEQACNRGARVLCGGATTGNHGFFLEPTVLADVPEDSPCMLDETFAPVIPVMPFDGEEQAVKWANATRYGLSAYAFTSNLSRGWRLAEQLEAGTIGINDGVPSTSNCPFGGLKQSGWGRELGVEGIEAFLETKHVSMGVEA